MQPVGAIRLFDVGLAHPLEFRARPRRVESVEDDQRAQDEARGEAPPRTFADLAARVVVATAEDDLAVARRALAEIGTLDPSEVPHALDHYRLRTVAGAVRRALGSAAAPLHAHFVDRLRPHAVAHEDDLFGPWLDADVAHDAQQWAARAALVVTVPHARRPLVYGTALDGWYSVASGSAADALDAVARALPCGHGELIAHADRVGLPLAFVREALTLPSSAPGRAATAAAGVVRRSHVAADSVLLILRVSDEPMRLADLASLIGADCDALRRVLVGDRRMASYGGDRWGLRDTHGKPPRARGLAAAVREVVETSPRQLTARQVAERISLSMPATRATVTSAIATLSQRDAEAFDRPPDRPVPAHIATDASVVTVRLRGAARRSSMLGVSRHLHWAVGVDGRTPQRTFTMSGGHVVVVELRPSGRSVIRYLPRVITMLGVDASCELELRLDLRTSTATARAVCACHGQIGGDNR